MYLLRKNYLNNFLLLIILLFCITNWTIAQLNWQQTNGPYGGTIYALEVSGTNLFAVVKGSGVLLSTNNGSSWSAINTGLGSAGITSIAVSGTNIFAGGMNNGVSLSNNNGLSWTKVNNGLTSNNITALAVSGTNLFAGSANNGVFKSTNNGANWSEVNNGLTKNWILAFAVSGTNLFASNSDGVFLSTNNGSSWSEVNTGLTNNTVFSFAVSGSIIFAGTNNGGIFLSSDNGSSWIAVNAGLTSKTIMALAVSGMDVYAGTGDGSVFKSTNNGLNWSAVNGLIGTWIKSSIVSGKNLFVGTIGNGVFLSTNNGSNWTSINTGLASNEIFALAVLDTYLFAGTNSGVFLSTNNGSSWTATNNGLPIASISALLVTSGTNLFAGTGNGVFLSTNNGSSWSSVNTGLTNSVIQALAVSGNNLIAGTNQGGIFFSTNNGTSWSTSLGLANADIYSFAVSGTNIFAGTNQGVFLSTNSGSSWYAVNEGINSEFIHSLAVSGTNLFAGSNNGVFLSTNMGASWNTANNNLTNTSVFTLAVSDTCFFAGTWGSGVFLSTISITTNPIIKSFSPTRNALNVDQNTNITIAFNTDIDQSTLNNSTIKVNGSVSGLHTCTIGYSSSTYTATVTHNIPFKIGEIVTITFTRGIKNIAGDSLASNSSWQFTIKTNAASAAFTQTSALFTGNNPTSVAAGDYNKDGHIDLAVVNSGSDTVTILTNNGSGQFTQTSTINSESMPWTVTSGDWNGDSYQDLAVTNKNSNTISILTNNGNGQFIRTSTIGVGDLPYSLTSGDWNCDGYQDIAVANWNSNTVTTLLNNGSGQFTQTSTLSVGISPNSFTSGDWNNDGYPDLAVVNWNANTVSILNNDGGGHFVEASIPEVGIGPISITSGDWNNDGYLDIATANFPYNTISILNNNGSSQFTLASTVAGESNPNSIISGDWNGDGHLDLAVTNSGASSYSVSIMLNNGNGQFSQTSAPVVGSEPYSVTSGDWNGDGRSDLAVANHNSDNVTILMNGPSSNSNVKTYQKTYGGSGDDYINKFIPTPDGGYLAAAYSNSCTSADIDVCLFKTDSAGTLQWARNFGDSESDYGSVGIADATGYMIVGYTDVPEREQDMFLARTDLLGHIQWKKTYGGIGNEFGGIIHRTRDGNYVITGNTTSFSSGTYDGFLMKTDSIGNVLWFRTYARMPEQTDLCNDVLEESDGSFIMTGATYEWGDHDMMLVKTDPLGNLIWSKKYSLPYQEMGNRIVKASNGDYFIVAESGPTTTDRAAVLYRVDPAGNLLWTKTYRSPISGRTFNSARGVAALPDGGIVIVGKWGGSGLDNNSSGFILKADSNGNFAWCREYSGSNTEFSWSVYQTNDGGFVLGGHTDNSGNGGKDCYLVKTNENGLTGLGDTSVDPIVETPVVSVSTVTMNCSIQSVTGIEGQFLHESDACFDSYAHPSNDLVAYYPFNSNANDSSGNGYNATYINTSLTTDRFGNNSSAYSFNGTNNTIQYGDILDEVFCAPVAKFTITGWANTRTCGNYTTGGGMIMSKSSGGGGVYQWNITHQENQVNVAVISDGIAQNYLWLTSPMPTNQWFQFTLVFDGSLPEMERLKLYLNGQSSNTTVYKHIGTLGTSTQNSTQNVCIGASHEYGDPQNLHSFYDGSIDDIRIYSKALTQEEIDSLYHEGGWNPTTYSEPRVVFSRDVSGPIYAGISILGNNAMYVIASGYAVYRLNTDGSLIYELQVNGEIRSASSIAHDNTVYIASSDRNLYAFTKEGNSAWPPLPTGGILTATPTIDSAANRLYIGVSNHNFIAVNRSTGDVAWNYFADDEIRNSAVITGNRKLVFATQKGTLYGFDLKNLSLPAAPTWQIALPDTAPSSFALDKQGNIYLGTGSGKLLKVALPAKQQPQILWQTSIGGPIVSAPVIDSKGTLYVGSIDAKLYAIDISSGTVKWSFATSGPIQSTPTISNQGNIFVANDNGEVYSLDSNQVVRWYYKAGNAVVSPLLYYKSTLFFGTLGNEVIALYDSSQSSYLTKSSVTAQVLEDPMWSTFQGNIQRTGMADVSTSTGVENDKSIVPTNYALFQNYPNPFNPSTIISYELPTNSKVTIKVYNMLGQQLFMLVNDYQSAGYHEVKFESSSLPSGIYFYQMTAGSYVQTKKMILMK